MRRAMIAGIALSAALVACGDSDDGGGVFTGGGQADHEPGPEDSGGDSTEPGSEGDREVLDATVIDLSTQVNDYVEGQDGIGGAIGDRPVDPRVAFGLSGSSDWGVEGAPEAEGRVGSRQFVAVIGDSGCMSAESAELWREGGELGVTFLGEDPGPDAECESPYRPYVQFEVPGEQLDGIETVYGREPLDPAGPGELVDLVRLGVGDEMGEITTWAGELPSRESTELAAGLELAEAEDALEYEPPEGMTGFFFVVSGCQEDTAELVVTQDEISPVLAQSDPDVIINCAQPVEHLVTFQVPDDAVPEDAELEP